MKVSARLIAKVRKIDEELGSRLRRAVEEDNVVLAESVAEKLAARMLAKPRCIEVAPGWRLHYWLEPTELALKQGDVVVARLGECRRLYEALRIIWAIVNAGCR